MLRIPLLLAILIVTMTRFNPDSVPPTMEFAPRARHVLLLAMVRTLSPPLRVFP
jgi:hypothetical protein